MKKFLIIFTLAILIFGYPALKYSTTETIEITIKDKERITTGSGEDIESKYLVYTTDEVFENTDTWLFMKFGSSDVQNDLTVGKTFKVKVCGWRLPFFSAYRNIISIQE